jgi:spermidine synthase
LTFRELISNLWGIRIRKVRSPLNGSLEVWFISGKYQLDAENVNYSYGSLHRVFRHVFKETGLAERRPANMLLLGVGAGSVISILRDELRLATHVTGIEHDPIVIDLARKYFSIDRFTGLEIICRDAFDYVAGTGKKFDVVTVDLFHDENVPEKFQSGLFLEHCLRLLNENGLILYNFIVKSRKQQKQFDDLSSLFRSHGRKMNIIELFGTNKVIVFSN